VAWLSFGISLIVIFFFFALAYLTDIGWRWVVGLLLLLVGLVGLVGRVGWLID